MNISLRVTVHLGVFMAHSVICVHFLKSECFFSSINLMMSGSSEQCVHIKFCEKIRKLATETCYLLQILELQVELISF